MRFHALPLAALLVLEGAGLAIVDAITASHHERLGGVSRAFEPSIELELAVVRRSDARATQAEAVLMDLCDRHLAPLVSSSIPKE